MSVCITLSAAFLLSFWPPLHHQSLSGVWGRGVQHQPAPAYPPPAYPPPVRLGGGGAARALLVGVDYYGTRDALSQCARGARELHAALGDGWQGSALR